MTEEIKKSEKDQEAILKEAAALEKERDEYLHGWKRAKADLINYQKDESKRLEEVLKFGNVVLLGQLLPVLDSFDFAMKNSPNNGSIKDLEVIRVQFEDIFKRSGLEKISVAVGQKFDPNFHESIGEAESDQPSGSIAEVATAGYLLNGRVIRPAKVVIGKARSVNSQA